MKQPVNQLAEVLYELIVNETIDRMSIMKSTGILNVTARISDLRLRHNVIVLCDKVCTKNKHGRSITYGKWRIPKSLKKKYIEKYDKINSKI